MPEPSRPARESRVSAPAPLAWAKGAEQRLALALLLAALAHAVLIAYGVRPGGRARRYQLPTARLLRLPPPLTILPPVVRGPAGGGITVPAPGPAPQGAPPAAAEAVPVRTAPPEVAAPQPGAANGVPAGQGGAGTGGGRGGGDGPGTGGGEVRQEIEPARLLSFPWPHYPESARRQKVTGGVVLSVHVTPEGLVDSVRVVRGLALPELNEEAVQVARRLRYQPARLGERPIASWQAYTVAFDKP